MNPAAWGGLSALSLGSADFAARFSSRALGPSVALFGMLMVGSIILSLWVWISGTPLVWEPSGFWLLVINGIATMAMTLCLYTALARGPVSVVAPIVASHPALVVAFWVALGTRPSVIQWSAMAVTVIGVIGVARFAKHSHEPTKSHNPYLAGTLAIAGVACVLHAVMVVAGQAAVPIYGELQTLWLARLIGLLSILTVLAIRTTAPIIPLRWWPTVALQGCLDAAGYLFLFAGSQGDGREIVAVTASAFGTVTTLLARFILRETMSWIQWCGIALVFGGIAVLVSPL